MAEQYASFQGKEPNIDVNLFVNALTQGIAAGNAQKTTLGAIAEGISGGIKTGIATTEGIQEIRANAANLEVNTDDEVIQARKDKIKADAEIAQAEAKAKSAEDASITIAKVATAKTQAAEAEQKLGDIKVQQTVGEALSRRSPEELNSILNDPNVLGTMRRNTAFGNQVLAGARGVADPALINNIAQQIDAVELQKQRASMLEDQARRKQIAADKNEDEFTQAQYSLQGLQGVPDVMGRPGFVPSKLKIFPEDSVRVVNGRLETSNGAVVRQPQVGPISADKGYVLAYGDQVLDTLNHDEGRNYSGILENFKKGAAARPDKYPVANEPTTEVVSSDAAIRTENLGLAGNVPTPVAGPAPVTNADIVAAAKQRNERFRNQAIASGQGNSYTGLMNQGAALSKQNTRAVAPPYISSSQAVKSDPNVPPITVPTVTPVPDKKSVGTIPFAEQHLSQVLDGAKVKINTDIQIPQATADVVQKINATPALANRPALIKGLVAVESAGNPNAKSAAGAAGLFQFMEGAASDVGLSPEDRTNVEKSVPAGVEYITKQYDAIEKQLAQTLNDQGVNVQVDPRMVLASYNGGFKWIKQGLAAGNTDWESMKDYLLRVKSEGAAKENTEYPDKVITAAIPFIKGGNVSDDSFVRTLITFGIIDVA